MGGAGQSKRRRERRRASIISSPGARGCGRWCTGRPDGEVTVPGAAATRAGRKGTAAAIATLPGRFLARGGSARRGRADGAGGWLRGGPGGDGIVRGRRGERRTDGEREGTISSCPCLPASGRRWRSQRASRRRRWRARFGSGTAGATDRCDLSPANWLLTFSSY